MRVVHLCYNANGGAGRAAERLHASLLTQGIDSHFLHVVGDSSVGASWKVEPLPSMEPVAASQSLYLKQLQWDSIQKWRVNSAPTIFTIGYPGIQLDSLPIIQSADILHFHWINWMVTPQLAAAMTNSRRKVVWTLHDMWPFTGGCHYSAGCTQYETACLKCPQIEDPINLVSANFLDKLAAYGKGKKVSLVCPSKWMMENSLKSRIFSECAHYNVPNPVDTKVFRQSSNRRSYRVSWGIRPEDFVLLFGNFDNNEPRKGSRILESALPIVAKKLRPQLQRSGGRVVLLIFGKGTTENIDPSMAVISLGELRDDTELADIYSMADLFCLPSLHDNYPNTIVEAFSCGTPAVAFGVGGLDEMIADGETGILITNGRTPEDFADGIVRFYRQFFGDTKLRTRCRTKAETTNSYGTVGQSILNVYRVVLEGGNSRLADKSMEKMSRNRGSEELSKPPRRVFAREDDVVGPTFTQYPQRHAIQKGMLSVFPHLSTLPTIRSTPGRPSQKIGHEVHVLLVRSYHSHHSARSGPYQYARWIDPLAVTIDHLVVPIGKSSFEGSEFQKVAGAVLGVGTYAEQGSAWDAELEVFARLQSHRYDIVHFLDGELCGWLTPRMLRHLQPDRRPATVMTLHQPPSILSRLINVERLREFDFVLAMSGGQATYLRGLLKHPRVGVIPHGIDTDFFRPAAAVRRSADRSRTMLAVGSWLRDYKTALSCFSPLKDSGIIDRFVVVSNLKDRRAIPEGVEIITGVSDERLLEFYQSADFLMLPLEDSTANNAILEAMACGLPIVTTDVGGIREMVGDAALLAERGDVAAHVAMAKRMMADAELRKRSKNVGLERAKELDWRLIALRYQRFYRELARETRFRQREGSS